MSYKPGTTVIVTNDDINHVGVVLDQFSIRKQTMYDVMLENRSVITMLNTSNNNNIYINRTLTKSLCESEEITTTIPYKHLVENDLLPEFKS
tara:strand:+ start:601 stop:876 length:276 start_codon:yes stop_codon:yes gene_type:complete